jgi:hypothetical protein
MTCETQIGVHNHDTGFAGCSSFRSGRAGNSNEQVEFHNGSQSFRLTVGPTTFRIDEVTIWVTVNISDRSNDIFERLRDKRSQC